MRSVFYEDWRACLRSHYKHVVLAGDTVTEPSLRSVLKETGFTDQELDDLKYTFLAEAGLLTQEVPPAELAEDPIEISEVAGDEPFEEMGLTTLESMVVEIGPEATLEPLPEPEAVKTEPEALAEPVPETPIEPEPAADPEPVEEPPKPPATPTVQLSFF